MKKGTFRKSLGIAAVIAVAGVIVMVALSPRREGFCAGMFTCGSATAEQPQPEAVPVQIPEAVSDSLPVSAEAPVYDSLTVK